MNSIFERDTKERCFLCGYGGATEVHHIFGAFNRKKSDKYGLTVHLCRDCHTGTNGVHNNRAKMDLLRSTAQRKWQETYGKTTSDFIAEFGRNYIDED